MNSVLYWKECINDLSQLEEYSATINALLGGEYANLNLEQLHIQSISPIYSIRHSSSTRLLFTTFQGKICILEVILNHDYAKSRFLRNRHCLKNHLQKISDTITSSEVEHPILPLCSNKSIQTQPVIFHQQFIELNAHQEQAIQACFPMILHGPAGSGKTTVAIELLKKLDQTTTTPIIYLTESPKLRDYVQDIWFNLHQDETNSVQFLTYQEFLIQVLYIPAEKILTREHFYLWFKQNKKAREFPKDELFKEFRIISGYSSLEKYQALGIRQSHFTENRKTIYDLFENYMQNLGDAYTKELSSFEISSPDIHLVIDEAQDLSYGQLKTLLNFAGQRCAILLGDHQVLFDGLSRFPYIKQYYYDKFSHVIQTYALSDNYRCSEKISHFANQVTQLKYHQTGGALDKIEVASMASNIAELGITEWFKARPEQFAAIQQQDFSKPYAIINFSHSPHESFKHPLVFSPFDSKGLEFDTVILWKPFESNPEMIDSAYKTELSKETLGTHRAKYGQSNLEHLNTFNAIITSITRAQKRLIIIDGSPLERSNFLQRLYQICNPIEQLEEEQEIEINVDMWLKQAQILFQQGYESQSKRILIEKLQYTEEAFESFKQDVLPSRKIISSTKDLSPATITERHSPVEEIVQIKKPIKKKLAIQAILEIENFFQESDYITAFQVLFSSKSNYNLETLLILKYPDQSIIDCINQNENYWHALIYTLASHSEMLAQIAPISKRLENHVTDKYQKNLLLLIDKYKKLILKKNTYTLLHIACIANDYPLIELCLKLDVDVNLLADKSTIAHIICNTKHLNLDCLELLLQYGAPLDKHDGIGYTPLHYLVTQGHITAVEQILTHKSKFDIHAKTIENETALDLAIKKDNLKCFQLLINHGANPYHQNSSLELILENKKPAFFIFIMKHQALLELFNKYKNHIVRYALKNEKYQILDALKNIIDFNLPITSFGEAPIHLAVVSKNSNLVEYLIAQKVDINTLDAQHLTPLNMACQIMGAEMRSIIEILLNHGANIQIPSKSGRYPLESILIKKEYALIDLFIQYGLDIHNCHDGNNIAHVAGSIANITHEKLIKLLQKYPVNLNQRNSIGSTPLIIAASTNLDSKILNLFYTKDVDLNVINHDKYNLLYYLLKNYDLKTIKNFVSKGLNLKITEGLAYSPLHLFIQESSYEKVKFLIEKGADFTLEFEEKSPLYLSMAYGQFEITELLLQIKAFQFPFNSKFNPFHLAARFNHIPALEAILQAGYEVDSLDEKGNAAIHYACFHSNLQALNILTSYQANFNLANAKRQTPLILACISKQISIIGTVLKQSVDISAIDEQGNSAIFYLSMAGYHQIIKKLTEKEGWHAELLNIKNQEGYTALHMTCLLNNLDMLKVLLQLGANPFIKNHIDFNALHLACKTPGIDKAIIQLLMQSGLSLNEENVYRTTPLMLLIENNPDLAIELIQEIPTFTDSTLLYASQYGTLLIVKKILSRIEHWNAQDEHGMSALLFSFLHQKWDIFKELCFHGAKYQLQNAIIANEEENQSSTLSMR